MLARIISGGQTGADQAAWRTAQTFGIETGGWMPRGFQTDEGPRADFASQFGAMEMPTESYPMRTEKNVCDSDATLWFGETSTSGANSTIGACQRHDKPCLAVCSSAAFEPSHVVEWLAKYDVRVLNVAGNRESGEPGIGQRVAQFLAEVLELLGHHPA